MTKKQIILLISTLLLAACGGGGGSSGGDDPGFGSANNYDVNVSADKSILLPASSVPYNSENFLTGSLSNSSIANITFSVDNGSGSAIADGEEVNVSIVSGGDIARLICYDANNDACYDEDDDGNTVNIVSNRVTDIELAGGTSDVGLISNSYGSGDVTVRVSINNAAGTESVSSDVTVKIGYGSEYANSIVLSGLVTYTNTSATLTGAVLDESAALIPDDNNNNVIVKLASAPNGVELYGVDSNGDTVTGDSFSVSTRDGLAYITVLSGSNTGDINYQMITDGLDNNVDNGISQPIISSGVIPVLSSSTDGGLTIVTDTLLDAAINESYSAVIASTGGGVGSVSFFLTSGALPSGLTLSNDGVISGTPIESGEFDFAISAQSVNGDSDLELYTLFVAGDGDITFVSPTTGSTLDTAVKGFSYNQVFVVSGTTNPTFAISNGDLPSGLSLSSSGTISGTVTATTDDYSFTVKVTDNEGNSAEGVFTLPVVSEAISIDDSLSSATVGTAYSDEISAGGSGGYTPITPITWSISSGSLPAGLSLDSNNLDAIISGTPTTAGVYTFVIKVTDGDGVSGSQIYSLIVN